MALAREREKRTRVMEIAGIDLAKQLEVRAKDSTRMGCHYNNVAKAVGGGTNASC